MKNTKTIAVLLVMISSTALAQNATSSAGQTVILTLNDAIENGDQHLSIIYKAKAGLTLFPAGIHC